MTDPERCCDVLCAVNLISAGADDELRGAAVALL